MRTQPVSVFELRGDEAWIKKRFFVDALKGTVSWEKMPNGPNKIMPRLCIPMRFFSTARCLALLMPRDFTRKANGWIHWG